MTRSEKNYENDDFCPLARPGWGRLTKAATPAEVQPILKETGVKGGLIVHLGCGEGKLTVALHANDSFLVQGLDADPVKIAQARQNIQMRGLYGQVTAELFAAARLPYVDNLVNLLVVENAGGVGREEMLRVLCPNGVAYCEERLELGKNREAASRRHR